MALPDLASASDLSARFEPDDDDLAAVMLTVASALVRQAAGSPISETSSTVSVWALDRGMWLDLPGQPISAVSSVTVDGTVVTDYKLINGRLWRRCGWTWCDEPLEVVVAMTHGLAEVPADIVQLVCDLAILGTNTAADGAIDPRVITEKIDDYSVTFSAAASTVATAMTLPSLTRLSLKARFGGGAGMVVSR